MANVFISHRGVDFTRAEKLASEIRDLGHNVWLDAWEIKVGVSIIDRINIGLSQASHLILCYSSSRNDAPWYEREWQSTLARQLNGYPIKILPVLLPGGKPPAIMEDIFYIDLVRDWNNGVIKLLNALNGN